MASTNIGETLKKARMAQNITLDELQQQTKIQKRYLQAIEENDFTQLPSDFYVRTFIRQYADIVNIDGDHLVDVFDGKVQTVNHPELKPVEGTRKNKHVENPNMSRFRAGLPMMALGLVAIAILTVVGYLTWIDHRSNAVIPANSAIEVEKETQTTTSSSSETKETETTKSSEPEKPKMAIRMDSNTGNLAKMKIEHAKQPIKLTFTGKDVRCWVGLQVNGAYIYQYTLQPNEAQTTEIPAGTTNATITVGVAKYVEIKANDTALDFQPGNSVNQKNVQLDIVYEQ